MAPETGASTDPSPRVSALPLDDGGLVLYREDNDLAWIQTDSPVELPPADSG